MPKSPLLKLAPAGLYCERGGFYIDPSRSVPKALITHAHSDHARAGSGAYLCASSCISLLKLRLGKHANVQGIKYGETITLGDTRVSFHPAGHILGSAQVRIEAEGEVWVVSGDYKRAEDPTCDPFEVVTCDTFITEATFGIPIYRWEPGFTVAQEIFEWWEQNRQAGRLSLLLCYALGKAQRILADLAKLTNKAVGVYKTMEPLIRCYREAGVHMLPTYEISKSGGAYGFGGELLLLPPSARDTPWIQELAHCSMGFASGWMKIKGSREKRGLDRGFILSDHADWPGLLKTIEDSKAKRILVMHYSSEVLIKYLQKRGVDIQTVEEGLREGSERDS